MNIKKSQQVSGQKDDELHAAIRKGTKTES